MTDIMIARVYWRSIRRGVRTIREVPDALCPAVKATARQEAASGAISPEAYQTYTGEAYAAGIKNEEE